jgi:outer membrane protein OmpA-like peptidoglycan-associated protein
MRLSIFVFLVFLIQNADSQNLIKNAGFEHIRDFNCCANIGNNFITDWVFDNVYLYPVHKKINYSKDILEKQKIFEQHNPNAQKVPPHSGDGMLPLGYIADAFGKEGRGMIASMYPSTKLAKKLIKGKKYRLEFWVYEQLGKAILDKAQKYKSIGCMFTKERFWVGVRYATNYFCPEQLVVEQIPSNQWHKYSQEFIAGEDNLEFMTIGFYFNGIISGFKVNENHTDADFRYYVDNMSLLEIDDNIATNLVYYEDKKCLSPKGEVLAHNLDSVNLTLLYDTNEFNLLPKHRLQLDSIARLIKLKKNTVFSITGHTDKIGSENEKLSHNRATLVYNYLTQAQKVHPKQFKIAYLASRKAIDNNNLDKNRRVEIVEDSVTIEMHLYKSAIKMVKLNLQDSAFTYLGWYIKEPKAMPLILKYDDELKPLFKNPKWQNLNNFINNTHKKKYKKGDLSLALENFYIKDQWYRTIDFRPLKGYEHRVLPKGLDSSMQKQTVLDKEILQQLEILMAKYGYPKKSEVGELAANSVALIIAHNDIATMKKWLPTLEALCKQKEANCESFAILFDRVLLNETKKQRYGTQYGYNSAIQAYDLAPLEESREKTDALRIKLGLSPTPEGTFTINSK